MYTETVWGKCWIRPVASNLHSQWIRGELFQVNEKGEFTTRGIHYIPNSMIQNGETAPDTSKMIYVSGDIFDNIHHEAPKSSFSIHKKVDAYTAPELKVFAQHWMKLHTVGEVAHTLGINVVKCHAIVKRLRNLGIRVPVKPDEKVRKPGNKNQFDWIRFARTVKGAYSMEFVCNTLNMEVEDVIARCVFLQEHKVPALIPKFDDTPEWLKIRMGRELKQLIFIGDKHGSGKNFKIKYAGYKRRAARMPLPSYSEMMAVFK